MSICSCLARNDYNVVFSLLILMIFSNFYNSYPQICSKIIIHLLTLLIIADIIWLIAFSSAWVHSKNAETNIKISEYWNSLKILHGFIYFIAILEVIFKGLLLYYLFEDYKGKYSWKDLFNLKYNKLETNNITIGNEMNNNNFFNSNNNNELDSNSINNY